MWFLDLGYEFLGFILVVLFFAAIYVAANSKYLKEGLAAGVGCLAVGAILMCLTLITYEKLKGCQPNLHEGYYTFGDTWCAFNEYEGELCKSHIHYALDNKALVDAKLSQMDEERRQDELKQKAHEARLRANFEKIVAEKGEK